MIVRVNMTDVEDASGYVHRVMDTELPYSVQDREAEAASEIAFSLLAEWTVCLWLCVAAKVMTHDPLAPDIFGPKCIGPDGKVWPCRDDHVQGCPIGAAAKATVGP